jgi:hypothetical protein
VIDHSDSVGWPAAPTRVHADISNPDRWIELYPQRARRVELREANRKWLAQPGNLEKKREAHRAWRRKQRDLAREAGK